MKFYRLTPKCRGARIPAPETLPVGLLKRVCEGFIVGCIKTTHEYALIKRGYSVGVLSLILNAVPGRHFP